MQEICPKCKRKFTLGEKGSVKGCDRCTGAVRVWHNNQWNRWYPDETEHHLVDDDGNVIIVTRAEAFGLN